MKKLVTTILLTLYLFSCTTTEMDKTVEDLSFWSWFKVNSDRIYNFEEDREKIFNEIIMELHRVDENLSFEIGPVIDGKREFIISADGIYSSFSSVEKLYDERIELDQWTIIKFRQRKNHLTALSYGGKTIEESDILFALFDDENPEKTGVILFIDGANEEEMNLYNYLGLLYLDQVIGEFDTETYVGAIIVDNFDSEYLVYGLPISMLAEELDKWKLYR